MVFKLAVIHYNWILITIVVILSKNREPMKDKLDLGF